MSIFKKQARYGSQKWPFLKHNVSRTNNFSLIELLITISIIAILVSILLPSLSKAREAGRAAECRSREKQFGLGFSMYANDNDQFLPLCYSGYNGEYVAVEEKNISWIHKVGDYLRKTPNSDKPSTANTVGDYSDQVMRTSFFWCKSPVVAISPSYPNPYPYGGNETDRNRYAMNSMPTGKSLETTEGLGDPYNLYGYRSLKQITTPSQAFLVGECFGMSAPVGRIWIFLHEKGNVPHSGRGNALYVDGHVNTINRALLLSYGEWAPSLSKAGSYPFWYGKNH